MSRRVVWSSTDGDLRKARDPGLKERRASGNRVRVKRETAGRRGKGVTTVYDVPLDDAGTDVVIQAYRDVGIRVVFSPMVWDIPPIAMVRNADDLPADVRDMLGTVGRPVRDQLDYLEQQFNRHPAAGTLHWAVAPFAPQRCTPKAAQSSPKSAILPSTLTSMRPAARC